MTKNIWWGETQLPEGKNILLNVSGLALTVEHKPKEWCLHFEYKKMPDSDENKIEQTIRSFLPKSEAPITRYIVTEATEQLEIKPTLADRTVVCRPVSPITLVPGAHVTLYLSTPIWLTLNLIGKKKTLLAEVASQRLSDTWFGASTREGDLCYASQTNGRLDLSKLPLRQQRATTPLIIKNEADNNLVFERVALPVPSLSLFSNSNGQLWTQTVTLTRGDNGDYAQLKLGEPPNHSVLVNGPRAKSQHGQIIRAFSAIFN
ncbi:MAG: hypothetical protein ACSHW0_08400 [Thalassotalea sp.]